MKKLIFLMSLILVSAVGAETKIYKYTDEHGNVYYSDVKPNDDATEAKLPKLTIIESKKVAPSNEPVQSSQAQEYEQKPPSTNVLANFKITTPAYEESIINTGGLVTAAVSLNGKLPKSLAIRFYLDGKPQKLQRSHSIELTNVFRGEHEIYAQAVDTKSNKALKTTPKVKFFVRQAVKKR